MRGRPPKDQEPIKLLPDARPTTRDLDEDGREHLKKLRAIMRERGTLSREYEAVIVVTAALLALWQKAQRDLAKDGLTYKANGLIKANPAIKIIQQTAPVLRGYLADLQLTPASRRRLGNGAGVQETDPIAPLLERAGRADPES